MEKYQLNTNQIESFITHVQGKGKVFAPHKTGENSFRFNEVEDPKAVELDYNRTLNSVKKYFLENVC